MSSTYPDSDIVRGLEGCSWKFAKTMPKIPHDYTLKESWGDKFLFEAIVEHIYRNGIIERFWNTYTRYYYHGEFKYWCYARVNPGDDDNVTYKENGKILVYSVEEYSSNLCILINRAKL